MIKYANNTISIINNIFFIKQIDLFAIEISNTEPNLTAMGLFDVDLKLIPKVNDFMKLIDIIKLDRGIKQMNI